jgi:glycosyltransferase involved in cell wall biosynthesis
MITETESNPLLTFGIAAYNQEKFIREAVEGAFSQTYSPLEIVLSDDCSADHTFAIMERMAAEYRGRHRIILNRNPVRRSLGGHINRVVEISSGELIVGAAGDDVSLPERCAVACQAWEKFGRRPTSIHSAFIQINEAGRPIGQIINESTPRQHQVAEAGIQQSDPVSYVRTLEPLVFGCAHSFSRKLFRTFGNLPEHLIHEDNVLALRSVIDGQIVSTPEPLVKYRVHGNNVFLNSGSRGGDLEGLERQEQRLANYIRNREVMYETFLADLATAQLKKVIDPTSGEQAVSEARRMRDRFVRMRQYLGSGTFKKMGMFLELLRHGLDQNEKRIFAKRLIPRALFIRMRLARGMANHYLGGKSSA